MHQSGRYPYFAEVAWVKACQGDPRWARLVVDRIWGQAPLMVVAEDADVRDALLDTALERVRAAVAREGPPPEAPPEGDP